MLSLRVKLLLQATLLNTSRHLLWLTPCKLPPCTHRATLCQVPTWLYLLTTERLFITRPFITRPFITSPSTTCPYIMLPFTMLQFITEELVMPSVTFSEADTTSPVVITADSSVDTTAVVTTDDLQLDSSFTDPILN